jgi:nicotinamide riboside kinase
MAFSYKIISNKKYFFLIFAHLSRMNSIVINFYGASCSGKSTIAAGLYATMKVKGYHTELVREYVKKLAWRDSAPNKWDQIHFLGQQINSESDLYNKVDYIITDSPILIVPFFEEHLLSKQITKNAALDFIKYAEDDGIKYLHFWLSHPDNFDQRGRFETKEESNAIAKKMKDYLTSLGVNLIELPVDHEKRISLVLKVIEDLKE